MNTTAPAMHGSRESCECAAAADPRSQVESGNCGGH